MCPPRVCLLNTKLVTSVMSSSLRDPNHSTRDGFGRTPCACVSKSKKRICRHFVQPGEGHGSRQGRVKRYRGILSNATYQEGNRNLFGYRIRELCEHAVCAATGSERHAPADHSGKAEKHKATVCRMPLTCASDSSFQNNKKLRHGLFGRHAGVFDNILEIINPVFLFQKESQVSLWRDNGNRHNTHLPDLRPE